MKILSYQMDHCLSYADHRIRYFCNISTEFSIFIINNTSMYLKTIFSVLEILKSIQRLPIGIIPILHDSLFIATLALWWTIDILLR